ncbi:dynein heavy chain domain-containing protein 1 [Xyrauchen texanus]|uniref:dynein heavy chain domain-containing protein 1 n=1 Tax=Xyrauchen texanus TaxID=154827 RepID=UPI00224275DE|nr:dynein heavy chain domain-containing protein 1 [Xyrauchen texanus]
MSSPKREPQGKGIARPAIMQSKREDKLDFSSKCSVECVTTALPAFKQETSLFHHTLTNRALSPPQYDPSLLKLPQLVSKVGVEPAVRESVWKKGPRLMVSALSADIPVKAVQHIVSKFDFDHEKPIMPQERTKTRNKCRPKSKPLTGTEVVEILAKKKHRGEYDFYDLKASEDGPYRPYDLHVVPSSAAGTDYYTFTPASVIHVQDGCCVELWTLTEWYRESVLWRVLRDIPFFRDDLLRKTFKRWHRNYLTILILIFLRLIEELKQINWLPQDDSRTYTLLDFQTALLEKNQAAQVSLDSFLDCRAVILNMVKDKSYQARQELQRKVEHSKLNHGRQSIYLHHTYLRNLQKELSQAERALQQLENLAALADCMTIQNLVTISKQEVTTFLNNVLKREQEQQGGLFQAEIVFGVDGQLTVFPPLHLFQEVLFGAVLSVVDSVLLVFDSWSLSYDAKGQMLKSSTFISGVEDLASRACNIMTTGTTDSGCAGPSRVVSQKECNMSPQTIVPVKMNSLRIEAQRVRGYYHSLSRRQLEWNLKLHIGTEEIQNELTKITQEAIAEVHQLCESHSWLIDVLVFTSQWGSTALEALQGGSSMKYEEQIKKLHFWMDRVHSMPSSFTTLNKLFTVKISNIQDKMGSLLSTIDEDVLNLLSEDLHSRSKNLASELKRAVEVMKSEPNNFDDFTIFTNMVKHSERTSDDMKQRLEDLHSLQQAVWRNYTHIVTSDGMLFLKQMDDLWNQFVPLLKQAADIETQQLPSRINTLDSNVSSLTNTVHNLVSRATSGAYLEPDQNAKEMLVQLNALCIQLNITAEQLKDQSRASESLRGHPLDLTFVTEAQQNIGARKGLWELMNVSSTQIQEWKLLRFSKFVVAKAQHKASEWLQQAEAFARVIPSHDAVLQKTLQILQGFDQLLPVLSKLCSPTLKHKHWRNISKGISLLYDPELKLTLADLMSKELQEHQNEINKIYLDAKAEADMDQTFQTLQSHWKGAAFCHSRFIIAVQQQHYPQLGDAKGVNTFPSHDSPRNALKHHIRDGGTFTIVGLEILLAQTKESVLILSEMLHSPHVAEFQEVDHWLLLLQELDELLDLFGRYQQKWIFLSKTFKEAFVDIKNSEIQEKFHPVDKMFQEIIQITVDEPHVLRFVQLTKTKETSQSFQGQSLCAVFLNGLITMEDISNQLLYVLESPRSQFPRLYFLSDEEVMKLLSLQLPGPSSLLPLVQKCFRGVRWLDIQGEGDVSHKHGLTDLCNEFMRVCGVYGAFREHVPFLCPLESNLNPVAWLGLFDQMLYQAIKQTILKCLAVQQCSGLEQLEDTTDLIGNNKSNNLEVAHEPPSLLQLISHYPLQCLLVAEEVLWCSMIQKSFYSSTKSTWAPIKSQNIAKLHYLCQVIKDHSANSNDKRIIIALRALVMLTMKHSQQTDGLVEVEGELESSFEWHKLLKYHLSSSNNQTPSDIFTPQEDLAYKDQDVYVDILCTQLQYGYEYIGPENWTMVTTPSTEQAYMGIVFALSTYKSAFISGPHMSGKQHTAVQLGYALGRQVVSMECCSKTVSSMVSQMLLGALQTGAWLVLDSVDSMGQGSLSVLGQHLTDIHQHFSAVQRHVQQEGHEPLLDVECKIPWKNKLNYGCITIAANGYSTEVPENLRVATRPVSLMQPNYRIISEVMLVSLGFSEAATISRCLVSLFSLAKDSHCLPDFVCGHQTSWLVLLKNVITASGTHLHHNCHLEGTDRDTFYRQSWRGSATTLKPLETSQGHYSLHFKSVNQSDAFKNAELEEQAVIKGVLSAMQFTVSDSKRASQFLKIFEEIFPKAGYFSSLQKSEEREQNVLTNAVKEELQQRRFYAERQMLQNVLILYQALKLSNVIVLIGPAGSGKTTLYQVLASALQKLAKTIEADFNEDDNYSSCPCWSTINTEVLFPNSFSHEEFFGSTCDLYKSWCDGAFTKALRHSKQHEHSPMASSKSKNKTVQIIKRVKWIVLDGDPLGKPSWLDCLTTLCDLEGPFLWLSSGEKVQPLRAELKILAEIINLGEASPSLVTHCNLVYVSGENMWRAVWKTEMDVLSREQNLDKITLKMWRHLAEDLFSDTVMFLRHKTLSPVMACDGCEGIQSSRITDGLQEVMSFIRILHALLEHFRKGAGLKNSSRQTETTVLKPSCADFIAPSTQWGLGARNVFVVAYIWGFGGHLHPRHWTQFDLFAREALHKSLCKVETPPEGTVFEHFFEFYEEIGETNSFINPTKHMSLQLSFTYVPQYEKHAYLLEILLDAHQPALLVGESGSGKTILCKSLLSQGRPHKHLPASPCLQTSDLCKIFKGMGYQNTQPENIGDALKQPNLLLFIDDLHEAPFDACGKTSMTLEILRQSISRGRVLNSDGYHLKLLQTRGINYLGTCSAPYVGNRNCIQISPRLYRLFTILALPSMTLEILFSIHSSKLQPWLKEIKPVQRVADMANCIITSTLNVYVAVLENFTTASCSLNVLFSLHDIRKVFQGMCLWRPMLDTQQTVLKMSCLGVRTFSSTEKTACLPAVLSLAALELNIARLWMHECLRTFGDRLASVEACKKLVSIIAEVSEKNFGTKLSTQYQTTPADISSPNDQSTVTNTHNLNQHLLSTPCQLEKNALPVLGLADIESVQTERVESYVSKSNSSLNCSECDEDASLYKKNKLKDDEIVEREPVTSECKYESVSESLCSQSPSGEEKDVSKLASQKELSTQHVPLTTCEINTPKILIELLQECASSIQNVVFSPELCGQLNNKLQHHSFKRNSMYQERDVDVLIDQLVHAIKSRDENIEEKSDNNYYSPTWAVHHQNVYQLVRILRAFLIPGGHGALFGTAKKTGRKSIIRQAVALAGYQLIEVHPGNEAKLREMLKEVGNQIAGNGGSLALLVHEDTSQAVKEELLLMMANGTLPGLYSDEEVKNVTLWMKTQGMKNSQQLLKDDQALEMYFKSIKRNMHVFLLYPLLLDKSERQSGNSLVSEKHISKALNLCCCVEVYQPWTTEALVESAFGLCVCVPLVAKDNLVASISKAMAGIHLSATKYAVTLLNFHPFSPRSYTELMVQFFCHCQHLFEQNRFQDNQLAKVLASVKEMSDTAARHTQVVLCFRAKCEEKQKCLDQLQMSIDLAQKSWEQTRHHSLQEENYLSQLEGQLLQVQRQIQDAFKQVSPLYQLAVEVLQSLNYSDFEEVRNYRAPPEIVVRVMDIICILFNHPCGWESCKQLLRRSSFFQELEFFDCSKLSDEMIQTLGQFVQEPSFQPSCVRDVSQACESLCHWVRAVYQYACVQCRMAPKKAQKHDLDVLMKESLARLRDARLKEELAREGLEDLQRQQELNRHDMELLEAQLSTAEAHERKTSAALKMVECHIEDWTLAKKEEKLSNHNIPGDALLLAGTVTYLGPFGPDIRQELLQKWYKLGLTGEINIKSEDPRMTIFNVVPLTASENYVPIPVSKTFQIALNRALGLDLHLIQGDYSDLVRNVLIWGHRVPCVQSWPLLADVPQHEELTSKTLFSSGQYYNKEKCKKKVLTVAADDPELLDKLNHGAEEGLRVLVTHIERALQDLKTLEVFVHLAGRQSFDQSRPVKAAHSDFHLFMSTSLSVRDLVNEIHPSFLDDVQIIDLSLSTTEVKDLILAELMQSECSKLWTLHCQVQTEKQMLQHNLCQNKVSLIEYILNTSTPLLLDPKFLPHVNTCQSVSLGLETKIKKLTKEIDHHKSLMADFYRVAELTTAIYNALQDVVQLSPCYLFTLRSFLLTIRSALAQKSPDMRFHGEMVPSAVIAEITQRIVSNFFSLYKSCLLQSHAALLRLMVSVALIVHHEGCSDAERVTFLRGLSDLKFHEPFLALSTQSIPELPSWIQTCTQADIYLLETIAPFRGLVSSLVNSSKLWQEYLHFPSSTVTGPVPCQSHSHLSTIQRAILWKTLCPHWLAAVEDDLAACLQGSMLHSDVTEGPPMGSPEALSNLLSKHEGPVVVHLPDKNETAPIRIHPLHLIKQVAQYQAEKKGVNVNVISFGTGCHGDAVLSSLDSAVQNGHWLVLNNCHLLDGWDVRVVNELTEIVSYTTKDLEANGGSFRNGRSVVKIVHPCFRLWLITKGDKPQSVPAVVRISALQLVWDSSWDLKDELLSSTRLTLSAALSFSPGHSMDTVRPLLQCAILHSVLMQRQTFKHLGQGQLYFWTQEDLLALIDAHVRIAKHCSDPTGALEYIAGYLVYGSHVSDHADLAAVQSIVRVCLGQPSTLWGRGPHILSDIISFTGRFDAGSLLEGLRHRIQSITCGTDPLILGFSPSMAGDMVILKSHTLNILLYQLQSIYGDVIGSHGPLVMQPQQLEDYKLVRERLLTLQVKLRQRDNSIGVGMESAYLGPLHCFFLAEWERLSKLVSSLLLKNFKPIKNNIIGSNPAYLTSSALSRLETQAELLRSYLWEESTSISPHAYQLAAFLNPQGFLAALIRDAAHIQQKDISLFCMHFKVLGDTVTPSSSPQSGVYLSGLELQGALWDPGLEVLEDTLSPESTHFPALWVSVEKGEDDRSSSINSPHFNSSSLPLYYCPLYVNRQTTDGDHCLSADNIITHVPLSTKLDPVLCTMRRVRLTSTLLQYPQ